MNDDELMAAVLEMTKKDSSLHVANEEDKLASSPDTGFGGDDDIQENVENMETMEEEKSKAMREISKFGSPVY